MPLPRLKEFDAGLIALGAALNVSIGYLTGLLKLPLYLDSIGTILISALCGPLYGVIVGLSALVILALTAVPTVIAYAGTAVVIALVTAALVPFGFLRNLRVTIAGGFLLGVAAAAASAPVTTFLYGGVSLAGADAVTTFLRACGMPLWKSALWGSLITDSFDKVITALICYGLIRSLPPRMLERITAIKRRKPTVQRSEP
jgi:energy-coupling factor transport system substrate-specific component